MAHYALVKDEVVVSVIVADQDFINTQSGTWVQTSYNTHGGVHTLGGNPLRKNYAGIGYIYDADRDAFYDERPYPSWVLNEDTCLWEPPIAYPEDDGGSTLYEWDEDNLTWRITND